MEPDLHPEEQKDSCFSSFSSAHPWFFLRCSFFLCLGQSCIQMSERISVLALSLVLTLFFFFFFWCPLILCLSRNVWPWLLFCSKPNTSSCFIPYIPKQSKLSPSPCSPPFKGPRPLLFMASTMNLQNFSALKIHFFPWVLMMPYGSFVHCQTSCCRTLPLFVLCFCN